MTGSIISVISAVEGNGAKYTTIQLAREARRTEDEETSILLIDFDFNAPFLAAALLENEQEAKGVDSLLSVLSNTELSVETLKEHITKTTFGVDLLRGTKFTGRTKHLKANQIEKVLEVAKESYDLVFVVTAPESNRVDAVQTLLASTQVLLVLRQNETNKGRLPKLQKLVEQYYMGDSSIKVIYNYNSSQARADVPDVVETFQIAVDSLGVLVYDEKTVDNLDVEKKNSLFSKSLNEKEIRNIYKQIRKEEK